MFWCLVGFLFCDLAGTRTCEPRAHGDVGGLGATASGGGDLEVWDWFWGEERSILDACQCSDVTCWLFKLLSLVTLVSVLGG